MSGDMTPREHLRTQLGPLLPADWRLIPYQRQPQTIDTTTVIVSSLASDPIGACASGANPVCFTITVVAPHKDTEQAEDALDVAVLELCAQLDALDTVQWTTARKVTAGEFLGWDIETTIRTDRE